MLENSIHGAPQGVASASRTTIYSSQSVAREAIPVRGTDSTIAFDDWLNDFDAMGGIRIHEIQDF